MEGESTHVMCIVDVEHCQSPMKFLAPKVLLTSSRSTEGIINL